MHPRADRRQADRRRPPEVAALDNRPLPFGERRKGNRRHRPAVEALDGRQLLSLGVEFAVGVGTAQTAKLRADAVALDAAGDEFITGSLMGSADFAGGNGTAATLASAGNLDLFVAKYSPSGALLWAEAMPGGNSHAVAEGHGIALDASGNLLLTGSFSGPVAFGPGPGAATLTGAAAGSDGFVAKLDGSGKVLWVRDIAATVGSTDVGEAVTADASGNVYATGMFTDTATLGGMKLTTGSQDDAFVTKLDPNGNVLWAVATLGSNYPAATQGNGIAVDASGDVAIAGSFAGRVDFDPGPGVTNLASAGSRDAFLWKLNPDGSLAWAERFGGADTDQANAVAVDASGDLVTTGTFSGLVPFGGTVLVSGGIQDVFVLKAGPAGNVLWARSFVGNSGTSVGNGVALDGTGDVFTGGQYAGTVNFNPGGGSAPLTSSGSSNVFVSELDPSGNYLAVLGMSAPGANAGFGLAANASGGVAVVGSYTGPATLGTAALTQRGGPSIFVAGLSSAAPPPPAPGAPALEAASDTGASPSDGITAATSPTFDVYQAIAGDTVELLRDGAVVASRVGPGAITDPGPVPAGAHAYTARQRNPSGGNPSSLSPVTSVTVLTAPPPAPAMPALLAADDSGTPGDGITDVRRPRLVGLATPYATVQLLNALGVVLGATTAGADGSYTVTPAADLSDGPQALGVRAVDLAGNIGAAGPALVLTIDTTPPAAPSLPALMPADDSGVPADRTTNNRQPRLIGLAEPGSSVQLLDATGVVLAATLAAPDGSYTLRPPAPLADGIYSYRVRAVDAAGNVGAAGPALLLTIDTLAPSAPAVPALLAADDSGVPGDGTTNNRQPRLVGVAEPGSAVQLLDATGAVLAATLAAPDGSYTLRPPAPLADGTYSYTVRAVDAAGNVGPASPALAVTIDTTPPAIPAAPTLLAADDSGAAGDGLTDVSRPRLVGVADPGATVLLLDAAGVVLGQSTAGADGSYTLAPTAGMADGPHPLRVQAVDLAGNLSAPGPALDLTIDTLAPATPPAPTLLPADDSGNPGDGITDVVSTRLAGTAEPGSAVQLLDGTGAVLAATAAGPDGSYTVQVPGPLADGMYSFRVRAVDAAGNVGTPSPVVSLTVDTASPATPAAPGLFPADDSGPPGEGLTNVRRPRLVGLATPGLIVQLVDAAGAVIGTATAGADGSYDEAPASDLADGTHALRVQAVDVAGNASLPSPAFLLTIDTLAPATPPAPALFARDDSGVAGDGITDVRRPRLVGVAEPGSTVQLVDAGSVVGQATAGADGAYIVAPAADLADGPHTLSVRAVDAAGNLGAAGPALLLTIDTLAPSAPAVPALLAADDSGAPGDDLTNIHQPRLVGFAEPGSAVQLLDTTGAVLTATLAAPDGSYTLRPPAPLADGTYSYTVRAVDAAGNVGPASPALTVTIDATPPATPAAPTLPAADDSGTPGDGLTNLVRPRLIGVADPGATVLLLDAAGGVLGTTTAAADGSYTLAPAAALADGTHPLRVEVVDLAGNLSAPGPALDLTIDTLAPATPPAPTLLPADDSGNPGDGITDVVSPRLAGTAEPGSAVQLLDGTGAVLAATAAGPDGSYTVQVPGPLADGMYSFRVRAVDAAGNVSAASPPLSLTIDATPPPAPAVPALLAADVSGTPGDDITNVRQPRLVGRAEPGSTVQWIDGSGAVVGSALAGPDGSYAVRPTSPLADGTYAYRVRAVDAAGNVGPASPALAVTIDATPPATPAAPTLLAADDSGTPGDAITNVRRPRLVGHAEADATVVLLDAAGVVLGWTTAGPDGSFTVAPNADLADGPHALRAWAIDAGNPGTPGPALTVTVDTVAPAPPAAPALLAADDSGTKGDGLTNVTMPRLVGTAEPGSFVLLTNAAGGFVAWTTAGPDGSYTVRPAAPLADGVYLLSVHAIDAAGNVGASGPALRLTIQATPPPAPAAPALLAADDSGTRGDQMTNVVRPRLTGHATPGAIVEILNASGVVVARTTAGPDGSYTATPSSPFANGKSALRARATDAAGNVGAPGPAFTLTIASTPPARPAAPALMTADMVGAVKASNSTTRLQPHLVGSAPAGDVVQLLDVKGAVVATARSGANGRYTVQFAQALGLGVRSWRVRVQDVAGNLSAPSSAFALTVRAR